MTRDGPAVEVGVGGVLGDGVLVAPALLGDEGQLVLPADGAGPGVLQRDDGRAPPDRSVGRPVVGSVGTGTAGVSPTRRKRATVPSGPGADQPRDASRGRVVAVPSASSTVTCGAGKDAVPPVVVVSSVRLASGEGTSSVTHTSVSSGTGAVSASSSSPPQRDVRGRGTVHRTAPESRSWATASSSRTTTRRPGSAARAPLVCASVDQSSRGALDGLDAPDGAPQRLQRPARRRGVHDRHAGDDQADCGRAREGQAQTQAPTPGAARARRGTPVAPEPMPEPRFGAPCGDGRSSAWSAAVASGPGSGCSCSGSLATSSSANVIRAWSGRRRRGTPAS